MHYLSWKKKILSIIYLPFNFTSKQILSIINSYVTINHSLRIKSGTDETLILYVNQYDKPILCKVFECFIAINAFSIIWIVLMRMTPIFCKQMCHFHVIWSNKQIHLRLISKCAKTTHGHRFGYAYAFYRKCVR